jgi:maleate cis-trans isomerase
LQRQTLWQRLRPVGAREERLGANEALFREVNERVAEVAEQFLAGETPDTVDFSCECADVECVEKIAMTVGEYEAVRAKATQFAVVPGHELPDIERVVARHPTYLVIEKQDPDAEEVARKTDPRT